MRKPSATRPAKNPADVRCAIYTHKSSEEGLKQDFNSLDAQREACEAYIRSQKAEGWRALSALYDDGGISGGTLERPALKRLLADIAAGRIDTVVVYKVDQLTRSLGDFVKIVEVFDRHQVSFVSITQAFNTTSSMGRLTLNMLLSFAQFEREVTGERIRDKIAASKRKGLWMGGLPPLGYDVNRRKLVINPAEAETVRHIYRRYAELGSVRALKDELGRASVLSKPRCDRFGRATGGQLLARGALYRLLQNRLYRGEVVHKGTSYPGEHAAIIDPELWDRAQQVLGANRVEHSTGAHRANPSLLAGLIFDAGGERLTPSHANKKGTRYRYYVSRSLITPEQGKGSGGGQRIPAGDLESLVQDRVIAFLQDEGSVFSALERFTTDLTERWAVVRQAGDLAGRWSQLAPSARHSRLQHLVSRIDVGRETVALAVRISGIAVVADPGFDPAHSHPPLRGADEPVILLTIAARLKRTGLETRLLVEGASGPRREPDRSLLRLLARAHQYRAVLLRSEGRTMAELAGEMGVSPSYFTRILKLSFLAPDIVQVIVSGRHPLTLTAQSVTLHSGLPKAWAEQRELLGTA